MKKIELKNGEKIDIRTDVDEMTIIEKTMFEQYFLQILNNFDVQTLATVTENVKKDINDNLPLDAFLKLQNFTQSIQLQEVGKNAWIYCFALLINNKPKNLKESELYSKFEEIDKKGLKPSDLEESVENFIKASPMIYATYLRIKERRDTLIEILSKMNL